MMKRNLPCLVLYVAVTMSHASLYGMVSPGGKNLLKLLIFF